MKTKADERRGLPGEAEVLRGGRRFACKCESRLAIGIPDDPIALAAISFAVLVRMQPPTVIRIGPNGDASLWASQPKAV